jgi:gliding motility-associated-like protein
LIDTVSLNNVLSNFSYAITDPCKFKVSLKNSSALKDTVTWQLPDTTIHAVDSAKVQLPGAGDNQVAMWIKGAPPFCQDTSRQTITVDSIPKVDFTANHPTCEPYLQVNPDTTNAKTIKWHLEGSDSGYDTSLLSLTGQDRLPLPASEPTYKVTAIGDPSSQCSDTVIKRIPVDSLAEAAFSLYLDTCNQKLLSKNQSPNGLQFRWIFGDGSTSSKVNPVHQYQSTGSFPVRLIAEDGLCKDTLTKNFQVLPIPDAAYAYQRDTCSATVNFMSKSDADHPHLWTFDNGDTSQKVNPVKTYKETGDRNVRLVVGPKGSCSDTVEKRVSVPDFVNAGLDVIRARCKPKFTLYANTNHADSIAWKGDVQPYLENQAGDSVVVNLPEAGNYRVKVIAYSNQCQDTATQSVVAKPAIEADFAFEQVPCRPEFKFKSNESKANNHLWLLGNSVQKEGPANFTHTYEQGGRYKVTYIANPFGPCADTAQQTLDLPKDLFKPLEIPNVFTPNGDGVNDYFKVEGLSDCDDFKLFIYNRWGQLVHKSKGNELKWDGNDQNNGNPLASGTYYYSLRGPNFQKEGTITLIRND